MKITSATPATIALAEELTTRVFKDPFLKMTIEKEEEFKYDNIRLLFADDGKLASTVCIGPKIMNFAGYTLTLGGVGGVATDPAYRGRKYANMLMVDAIKTMEKEGYDLSLLYPFKQEYYAQFGYSTVRTPFKVLKTTGLKKIKSAYVIKTQEKFKPVEIYSLSAIYQAFNFDTIGPLKRSFIYWQQKLERNMLLTEKIFIARKKGEIVAYMILNKMKNDWADETYRLKIGEMGCLCGEEKALPALAQRACKYAFSKNFKRVFYEDLPGVKLPLGKSPSAAEAEEYKNLKDIKMYRVINFHSLLKNLTPCWNSRLTAAGKNITWQDSFTMERVVDENLQGIITIILGGSEKTLVLAEADFVKMFLGYASFAELKIKGKDTATAKELETLEIIFPLGKPVNYDFDYL